MKHFNILWTNKCKSNIEYKSILSFNDKLYISSNNGKIDIFNKSDGNFIDTFKEKGLDFFLLDDYTDGFIINNFIFFVDKIKSYCKIINLKTNIPLAIFGFKNLNKPTCIDGFYTNDKYYLFIADDNKVIKYEIDILDDKINDLKSENIINLENVLIKDILIDNYYNRILIYDDFNIKLKIYDFNGKIIKELDNQAERIKSYGDYYLITDRKQDSNCIHLICKNKLEYIDSYSNKNVKYISDLVIDEEDIFLIDSNCSIVKIILKPSYKLKSIDFALFTTLGLVMYKYFNIK